VWVSCLQPMLSYQSDAAKVEKEAVYKGNKGMKRNRLAVHS